MAQAKKKTHKKPAVRRAATTPELPAGLEPQIQLSGRMRLDDLFHGEEYEGLRQQIIQHGRYNTRKGETIVKTREIPGEDGKYEILAMGARQHRLGAVPRDPGLSTDFLDSVQDLQQTTTTGNRATLVGRYWNLYKNSGLLNNATNKIAAILSGEGEFVVRKAKAGKKRKATEELQELLHQWTRRVNATGPTLKGMSEEPGVITGARGLQAINHQAVRYALVEGSWVARATWQTVEVEGLGRFDLPINLQTISTANLEPVKELQGTGVELFYWKPPTQLVQQVRNPATKEIKQLLTKLLPKDVIKALGKDGRFLLDPALLMHVRHRGRDGDDFGESFIQPALPALAYEQAVLRLDTTSMQNLVNRLVIVMVGSSDPQSPYNPEAVAQARTDLMKEFFEDPGPNMTIVWSGDDVKVVDVGAHASVLDLNERFKIADARVKASLGVGEALLSGQTGDGKAAGWAAVLGTSAQLEELANQFTQVWTTLGERIATENGYTDVDLVWEYSRSLLIDRNEERLANRADYLAGLLPIRYMIKGMGLDPDAVFRQKAFEMGLDPDDESTTWSQVFMPPQGLPGQGEGEGADGLAPPAGQGPGKTPGSGKTPEGVKGKPVVKKKEKAPTTKETK